MTTNFYNRTYINNIKDVDVIINNTEKKISKIIIKIKAGFLYETDPKDAGLGHILEHCLLDTWDKYEKNDLHIKLGKIGCIWNASTDVECIEFYIEFLDDYLFKDLHEEYGVIHYFLQSILELY